MSEDYIWGMCLEKSKPKEVWDPDNRGKSSPGTENPSMRGEHTLLLKQAVLGPEAKEGEVNVIEAEAMGYKDDVRFPIVVFKNGQQSQVVLDLLFPDPPVTFHLVKGNGPIYLLGNHTVGREMGGEDDEEDLDDELDEEDLEEMDESPERNNVEDRKRKLQANSNNKAKLKKTKVDDDK